MTFSELETAFKATTYRVKTPEGFFDLRVGIPHTEFSRFLAIFNCSEWGVITAHNPGGLREDPAKNEERSQALRQEIEKGGGRFYPTSHYADQNTWPVERGFCLLHASPETLRVLAKRFSQRAFVHGGPEACPELSWISGRD